jgi:hypothetical protein
VEELIRKGRNVAIQVMLLTQRATGDAIPTRIRDNCQVAISFATRTVDGVVAALGEEIRQHPDASPVLLNDPTYVGVAVTSLPGRPGFHRVRTPQVDHHQVAAIIRATTELRGRSWRVASCCGTAAAGGGAGMTAERQRLWAGGAWLVAQPQAHHEARRRDGALQADEQGQMSRPPSLVGRSVPVGQELIAPDDNNHRLGDSHQAHEGTHEARLPSLATADTCGRRPVGWWSAASS